MRTCRRWSSTRSRQSTPTGTTSRRDQQKTPGEDATADEKFTSWLRDSSTWVPLKVLLKAKPEDAGRGRISRGLGQGVPGRLPRPRAGRDPYARADLAEPAAAAFLSPSRSLGEAVSAEYPTVAMIERETHFNAINPFWQAPFAYGCGRGAAGAEPGIHQRRRKLAVAGVLGRAFTGWACSGWSTGIALEIYGFYLRVRITGWAPVTNMYETVIWVALVAAVLSLIFELIFRQVLHRRWPARRSRCWARSRPPTSPAGPEHQEPPAGAAEQLWLTIHVLTEVSSYAAFGAGLGARPDRDGLLPDGDLPPLAAVRRAGAAVDPWPAAADRRRCRRRGVVRILRPRVDDRRHALLRSSRPWRWSAEMISLVSRSGDPG